MLQVLRETLGTLIVFYSGAEVFLAMENLIEKSVWDLSAFMPEVFCQFEGKE